MSTYIYNGGVIQPTYGQNGTKVTGIQNPDGSTTSFDTGGKVRTAISKLFGCQNQVSSNAGVSAGASQNAGWVGKRELEIDAPATGTLKTVRIRLWILSRENVNKSEGWQVAIAPTETAAVDSGNAFTAKVGGRSIQYYASSTALTGNSGDQLGYVRGTFGNANKSGKLLPGGAVVNYRIGSVSGNPAITSGASASGIYSTSYGAICTDWMTVPLVPRIDTSPNGKTKALIQYRISKDGVGVDSYSQIGRQVSITNTGLSLIGLNYWQWLKGKASARLDWCLATTAANYDVTNTLTLAPSIADVLAAPFSGNGQGLMPYVAWEVDYGSEAEKVVTVAGCGDSMTESFFASVQFNGFMSNGTSGVAGNILTVTGYAANSGGGVLTSGMRVYNSSTTQFPIVIDQQLTGTTGKQGTYSLKISENAPYSGGAVSQSVGTSGSPVSFVASANDAIDAPLLWWKEAAAEIVKPSTIVETMNLGHSTHRIESFTSTLFNALRLGQKPDVLIYPLMSVNNFNPLNDIMGYDTQQTIQNLNAVLNVCGDFGIKVILWNCPNFAGIVNGGSDEGGEVNSRLNAYAIALEEEGRAYYLDLQAIAGTQANMNATYLVDGTHWNSEFQTLAKSALKAKLESII